MDSFKMQILELLQADCRISLERMAVMLDTTTEKVTTAIDEMERDHIILHYQPIINWDKTEKNSVEGIIEVKVMPQRDMGFDAVAGRIYRFQEVKSVYLMSGSYDLLVLIEAPSLKDLALFVSEKLAALDTVTGTSTSFVLKRYKQDGVIFESNGEDKRLAVSP